MTKIIGQRAAILAASSLVSVAVALGSGATAAQALEPKHGPTLKKEKESVTFEKVVWFDNKNKKHHENKHWDPRGDYSDYADEGDEEYGYDDYPGYADDTDQEESYDDQSWLADAVDPAGAADPTGAVDPIEAVDPATDVAPMGTVDPAAAALLAPMQDGYYEKDHHKNI
ncbi:hypothetical protein I7412_11090, partial [Frankia sp. CN6]